MEPQKEFLQEHVKELGARIIQELLSGLVVSPFFAYKPYEEIKAEPPTINSVMNDLTASIVKQGA